MNRLSSEKDVTAIVRSATPSPHLLIKYFCGPKGDQHKGLRAGGLWKGKLPLRCPNCNKGKPE